MSDKWVDAWQWLAIAMVSNNRAVVHIARKEQTMSEIAELFAELLKDITDEELERIIHDAKEEAQKEIARMKGADDEDN